MKNRGLATLIIALIIGPFVTSTFAEEAKPEKTKAGQKSYRTQIASCGLYSNLKYLTGEFSNWGGSNQFMRNGLSFGTSCSYNNHSRLSLGVGAEFYLGKFHLNHEENYLKGSASYLEMGFKEWVRATLDLNDVKIGALGGVERTNSGRFGVKSAQIYFGGSWLNFTKFATEHLTSSGELEIWEAGLDVSFPFRRNFSFIFGALWQRYQAVIRLRLDDEGKEVLKVLNYDVKNIEKDFEYSANFFYLTPGLNWCKKELCFSLTVPWGVFQTNMWSWGVVLGTDVQF